MLYNGMVSSYHDFEIDPRVEKSKNRLEWRKFYCEELGHGSGKEDGKPIGGFLDGDGGGTAGLLDGDGYLASGLAIAVGNGNGSPSTNNLEQHAGQIDIVCSNVDSFVIWNVTGELYNE